MITRATHANSEADWERATIIRNGGAEGVRTPDLLNAIQALYQLSYDPIKGAANLKPGWKLSKRFCWLLAET